MAKWAHRWVRLGMDADSDQVRVIATSQTLHWDSNRQHYGFEPDGRCEVRGEQFSRLVQPGLSEQEWADCIAALGEEGWELLGIVPLAADTRLREVIGMGGEYNTQLWVLKRPLAMGPAAVRTSEEVPAVELEGSEADRLEQEIPAFIER